MDTIKTVYKLQNNHMLELDPGTEEIGFLIFDDINHVEAMWYISVPQVEKLATNLLKLVEKVKPKP